MTIDEARAKAHQQYDDCMFCPGSTWRAGATPTRRKAMTGGSDEPIIIGLAIAVIIGTGIVCLKNKLK